VTKFGDEKNVSFLLAVRNSLKENREQGGVFTAKKMSSCLVRREVSGDG